MDLLIYIVIGILTFVFIWQELRIQSRFRFWNIISKIVIIICLILLYQNYKTSISTPVAFVLTPGYSQQQLDSLLNIYTGAVIYSAASSLPPGKTENLFILGQGLPEAELRLLSADRVNFLKAPYEGLTSLKISPKVFENEKVNLSGNYFSTKADSMLLKIVTPWKKDSLKVKGLWRFEFLAEQPGNFLVSPGNGKLNVPFKVDPLPGLNILLMTRQPGFQTNFLSNYLESAGHKVVYKTTISREISFLESASAIQISPSLTSDNLEKADLLILDVPTIVSLDNSRRTIIKKAVEQGLGLLILPVEDNFSGTLSEWINKSIKVSEVKEEDNIRFIDISAGYHPLFINKKDKLKSFYTFTGRGKAGSFGVFNDYYWKLSGSDSIYRNNWNDLLYTLARHADEEYEVILDEPLAFTNEPVQLSVTTTDPSPTVFIDQVSIPLKQDIYWPSRWSGTYWPGKPGWHNVHNLNDTLLYFYVDDKKADVLAPDYENISATAEFVEKSQDVIFKPSGINDIYQWLVIFVLLLSLGYLWIEPKL